MRFRKPKITQQYELAQTGSRRHLQQRPYIIPLGAALLALCLILAYWLSHNTQSLRTSDAHVVFLFDSGKRRTLDTKAKNVGELVAKLNLHLIKEDVVEPSLDTKIPEDNFRVNIYRARPVVVIDNSLNKTVTLTAQKSARVVAQQAGLKIYPDDNVIFGQGSLKENIIGEKVIIQRAIPVTLDLYGTKVTVRTRAATISDFLVERDIKPGRGDTVRPRSSTRVRRGLQISIIHNGTKVTTVTETIPAPIQYVEDASLSFGTTAVRQPGSDGKKTVIYQVVTKNGKVVRRKILQQTIIESPVPKIVARGKTVDISTNRSAAMAAAGIRSSDYGYVNYIISRESNWNPGARNPSGCLGLGQACPGNKLTAVCPNLDGVCQLRYFSGYAGRYGGWGGAYSFWASHHYW